MFDISASIQNSITALQKPDRALPHLRCFQDHYPGGDEMRGKLESCVGVVEGKMAVTSIRLCHMM